MLTDVQTPFLVTPLVPSRPGRRRRSPPSASRSSHAPRAGDASGEMPRGPCCCSPLFVCWRFMFMRYCHVYLCLLLMAAVFHVLLFRCRGVLGARRTAARASRRPPRGPGAGGARRGPRSGGTWSRPGRQQRKTMLSPASGPSRLCFASCSKIIK